MHEVIDSMLNKYQCQNENDYINALKEIFQEIQLTLKNKNIEINEKVSK